MTLVVRVELGGKGLNACNAVKARVVVVVYFPAEQPQRYYLARVNNLKRKFESLTPKGTMKTQKLALCRKWDGNFNNN